MDILISDVEAVYVYINTSVDYDPNYWAQRWNAIPVTYVRIFAGRGSDNDPDFFYWYQEDRGTWPDPLGGLLWPFGRTRRPTVRRPTRQPHFVYDNENTYLIEEGRSPPPTWLELFSGNRVSLPPSPQFIRRVGGRRPAPRRRRCNSCNR